MSKYEYDMAVKSAKSHNRLYHYTTFDSLKFIINNKSLRLSRIDTLNDTLENKNIINLWKNKVFVLCFTHRDLESYFFWKTYAKDSTNGVMISFASESLSNLSIYPDDKCIEPCLKKYDKNKRIENFSYNIDSESWSIYDYSWVDVGYVSRDVAVTNDFNFQGRIKYEEWNMELETRLRVAIRPNRFEYEDKLDNKHGFVMIEPHNNSVYAKLSNECFESMIITLSPFAGDDLCAKVQQLLIENNLDNKVVVRQSVLTGEISVE